MDTPTKYAQIKRLKKWVEKYLKEHGSNSGEYSHIGGLVDKPLRDGIIFYSTGWGWRMRKNGLEVLEQRMKEIQEEYDKFKAWVNGEAPQQLHQADADPRLAINPVIDEE